MLGVGERLVLADLGLCKDLALHSGHTCGGVGTEGFRPPELRGGPAIIDHRADLWSLSALVVWLATGTPPGTAALAGAGFPAGLAGALGRSLADDPGHRHPDALAWLADVEAALVVPAGPGPGSGPWTIPTIPTMPAMSAMPAMAPPGPWTPPPGYGPGPGASSSTWPTSAPSVQPPASWRLRQSAWVLTALGLGLTTWIGFLYVGARSGRTRWLWAAGAYGAGALAIIVLDVMTPVDENGDSEPGSWQTTVGIALLMVVWIGGLVHALLANRDWLRYRATSP